jgi:glycosyltransferase involved in cell wall biosynthesis
VSGPQVTVIIPCFNQAPFLGEAVRSIQTQTLDDWECIIINDGSTDDAADVSEDLAAADRRVRLVNQANRGLSGARNRGLAEARGRYVQFLDADDRLEARKLEIHATWLSRHPEVGVVYGEARYFTTEDPELRAFGLVGPNRPWKADEPWIGRLWTCGIPLTRTVIERNIMAVNCALVRREVFKAVGGWDESLPALEDWEFWSRCLLKGIGFQYWDGEDGRALVRSHSDSMSRNSIRMLRGAVRLRTLMGPLLVDQESRLKNYRCARGSIAMLPRDERVRSALALASANWCSAVCKEVLHDLLWRLPLLHVCLRMKRLLSS